MVIKRNIYLSLFLFFIFAACVQAQQAPVKIAIVADKAAGLVKSPLVSLLEVQLSQKQGIELLERAAIDKILQEQQLSAAGLLERNNTIKIGKLLRADAFVILSLENQTKESGDLIRVRVAETAHGLRLSDRFEELDKKKTKESAERIIKEIIAVAGKLNLPAGQAIPIGIVDIHRVQLGERHKLLERALPVLLSVRLSKEPKIIMLEREDLKVLLDEKLLTEGRDSEFWTSAVLIDGYLQPKDGSLEMTLQLRQAAGKEIATFAVAVEPNEPSLAIDKAVNEIVKQIQDSPPSTQWQPELEAEEFYHQGSMLLAHRLYNDAENHFETAHALRPENLTYTSGLFKYKWQQYIEISSRRTSQLIELNNNPDLELAQLVSLLVRQIRRDYEKDDSLSTRYIYDQWGRILGDRLSYRCYFSNPVSISSDHIREMNRINRKIWVEILDKALIRRGIKTGYPFLYQRPNLIWICYDDPEELFIHLKEIYKEFIMPPQMGGIFQSTIYRRRTCYRLLLDYGTYNISSRVIKETHLQSSEKYIITQWNNYLKELSECEDPLVRCYSYMACSVQLKLVNEYNDTELAISYCNTAIEILMKELIDTGYFQDDTSKFLLCSEIKEILNSITDIDKNRLVEIWERVYEPLIVKENISALALWDPGYKAITTNSRSAAIDSRQLKPEYIERYYKLLKRISSILEKDVNNQMVNRALNRIYDCQTEIRAKVPELRLEQVQSPLAVIMLLKREDLPEQLRVDDTGLLWHLNNNFLYIVSSGYKTPLNFYCVDLSGRETTTLLQTKLEIPLWSITGLAVGDNTSYVSVRDFGIIVLPHYVDKGRNILIKPQILNENNGLPSVLITDIASDGDRLWIAYGGRDQESGLGLYDPNAERWETVFCSKLNGENPLNSGYPYYLERLTFLSPDKLFFTLVGKSTPLENWTGLWMLDTTTRKSKYFGYTGINASGPLGYLEITNGHLWIKGTSSFVKFDPESGKALHLLGKWPSSHRKQRNQEIELQWLNCQDDPFIDDASINMIPYGSYLDGFFDLMTSTIHGDQLWARLGKTQIAILHRGEPWEKAEIIDNDILDSEQVERFVSTPYGLVAIGNGIVGLIETGSDSK